MNKYFQHVLKITLVLLFCLSACSGKGSTIIGNTQESIAVNKITLGQLTNEGKSTIAMPLAIFGDSESDIEEATVAISLNDVTIYSDFDAVSYFSTIYQAVRFVLSNLESGDEISFTIRLGSGSTVVYTGTFSSTANSYALNVVETTEAAVVIAPLTRILYLTASDGRLSDSYIDNGEEINDTTYNIDYYTDCSESGSATSDGQTTFSDDEFDANFTTEYDNCVQTIEYEVSDGTCEVEITIDGEIDFNVGFDSESNGVFGGATTGSPLSVTYNGNTYSVSPDLGSDNASWLGYEESNITGSVIIDGTNYDIEIIDDFVSSGEMADFCN